MKDCDIRPALHTYLADIHAGESLPLILDELELCLGESRADIAVVNGSLSGYEIKSERDTLDRLGKQVQCYGRIFEYACLVASSSHIPDAMEIIPDWWGVLQAASGDGVVTFTVDREAVANPSIDPHAVGMLLWRREAIRLLEDLGVDRGVRTKPTACMVSRLCESLSAAELTARVREIIKARGDWRSAARQKQCDARSQPSPRFADSRRTHPWSRSR